MFICNVVGYLSVFLSRLSRLSVSVVELCGDLTSVGLVTASQLQQAPVQMPLSVNLSAEVINAGCQLVSLKLQYRSTAGPVEAASWLNVWLTTRQGWKTSRDVYVGRVEMYCFEMCVCVCVDA